MSASRPFIIVFGNEKGGTGKSTLAVHVIVSLLNEGFSVASIDVDGRQGTLSRYLDNRRAYRDQNALDILVPTHVRILPNPDALTQLERAVESCVSAFVVIDTPGNDTELSRSAHLMADLIITPLNESPIDVDLLVEITSADNFAKAIRPSLYAQMIWEQRLKKASMQRRHLHWMVIKNRVQGINSRNKTHIDAILKELSGRFGFQIVGGFMERTIFRELFSQGLTLLDKKHEARTTVSHVAARQELRGLVGVILEMWHKSVSAGSVKA